MNRLLPILFAPALIAGCASNEALFAEYERPCPVRPAPQIALATAVVEEPAPAFEQAVFFAYRSAELDETANATLARIADLVADRPGVHLFLRGQTDWRGSQAVNDALARRRLEAVRAALAGLGLPAERLRGVAVGESETIARATAPVMDAARRVDVEFVDRDGRPLPIGLPAAEAGG